MHTRTHTHAHDFTHIQVRLCSTRWKNDRNSHRDGSLGRCPRSPAIRQQTSENNKVFNARIHTHTHTLFQWSEAAPAAPT